MDMIYSIALVHFICRSVCGWQRLASSSISWSFVT